MNTHYTIESDPSSMIQGIRSQGGEQASPVGMIREGFLKEVAFGLGFEQH